MTRFRRLEDRLTHSNEADWVRNPDARMRIVVCKAGSTGSLDGATCIRTQCEGGQLLEVVRLDHSRQDGGEFTDEQLNRWIDSFPVHRIDGTPI